MNAIVKSPVEAFVGQVLPPERAEAMFRGLPSHIKPERFERNLINAVMANPDLLKHDARLVYREVSKAAALGLLLDPQLGEAYLILAWNGKNKRLEPQLRVGYKGLIKLARQTGEIANIYAHEVCRNDYLECSLGDDKRLIHKPDLFSERGPIVGYYAVVKYDSGEKDFEPMSVEQIHRIRDRTDAWKAFKDGKIRSTPWSTDEEEMAKKTVLRRLVKRVPQSPELADAIRIEDAAEQVVDAPRIQGTAVRLVPPAPKAIPQQPAADEIEHVAAEEEVVPSVESDAPAEEPQANDGADWQATLDALKLEFDNASSEEDAEGIRDRFFSAYGETLSVDERDAALQLYDEALKRFEKPASAAPADDAGRKAVDDFVAGLGACTSEAAVEKLRAAFVAGPYKILPDELRQEAEQALQARIDRLVAEVTAKKTEHAATAEATKAAAPTTATQEATAPAGPAGSPSDDPKTIAEYEALLQHKLQHEADAETLKKWWLGSARTREAVGAPDAKRKAWRDTVYQRISHLRGE